MRIVSVLAITAACSYSRGELAQDGKAGDAPNVVIDTGQGSDSSISPDVAQIIDAPVLPDAKVCPAGYNALQGAPAASKYKIFGYSSSGTTNQSRAFDQAKSVCVNEGTHLAIANTSGEATALGNAIPVMSNSPYFWDGVTDAAQENTWLTVLGTTPNYLPWAAMQPNGGTGANCGIMNNGNLYDWSCLTAYPFACECE